MNLKNKSEISDDQKPMFFSHFLGIASKAWLDLGTYAREVLATQDTRRFVLGFTLCGLLMRIWEFDRLGGDRIRMVRR